MTRRLGGAIRSVYIGFFLFGNPLRYNNILGGSTLLNVAPRGGGGRGGLLYIERHELYDTQTA